MKSPIQPRLIFIFSLFLTVAFSPSLLVAQSSPSQSLGTDGSNDQSIPLPATVLTMHQFTARANKATYLNLSQVGDAVVTDLIMGKPPQPKTPAFIADETSRLITYTYATPEVLALAKAATYDIFSFSSVLGSNFSSVQLPNTTALFTEIDADLKLANDAAKKTFQRHHPLRSGGFCYPSDHAVNMFFYATLLRELYPAQTLGLYKHAKLLSYYRVIRGGHYPADIVAGESYGIYLASQFHKNSKFEKKWKEVTKEITDLIPPDTISEPSSAE